MAKNGAPQSLLVRFGVTGSLSRRVLSPILVGLALVGPAAATAQTEPQPQELRAHGSWISWWEGGADGERWFESRGGELFDTSDLYVYQAIDLGSDASGAGVTTFASCHGPAARPEVQTCAVSQARLPYNSPFRTLVGARRRFGVTALAQHRGALALGQWRGRRGRLSRVLLKRSGASHFATLAKRRRARRIDVGDGFVMYVDKTNRSPGPGRREIPVVYVADLRGPTPRERRIASSTDADCRCVNAVVKVRDATLDGHHAYWIEEVTRADGDAPLGTGGSSTTTTRLLRVDLLAPQPAVEGTVIGRATTLAVTGGLVFHDGREPFDQGYRPEWSPADPFTPVEP